MAMTEYWEPTLQNQTPRSLDWRARIKPYTKADHSKSMFQLVTTLLGFALCWALAYLSLDVSYWLTLLAAMPAAGFTVRLFIFSHDCGHGSFFNDRTLNDRVGFLTGIFAYTPYLQWRASHARHHARAQQIEERGVGYFWTMTVEEYRNSSRGARFGYRLYRHPAILFTLGGFWNFLVDYRFPDSDATPAAKRQVWVQDLVYAGIFVGLGFWLGFWNVFIVQGPVALMAATAGLWLFHVQHHYEDAYHAAKEEWSYERAALEGSSFLKLDPVSQYFAGNINFHHVHHLAPKVPNYRLKEAHEALDFLNEVKPLTVFEAMKSYKYTLIDERTGRWVGFGDVDDVGSVGDLIPPAPERPADAA